MSNDKTSDYTASYSDGDHSLAVPYSFRGSLVGEEELRAVERVLNEADTLTTGPEVDAFEHEFREFTGCGAAVATSSCTTALFMAHQLSGVGPGTEVIAPPLSFVASSMPAFHLGARVVFADVHPRTLNIDPASVRERITGATRAIVAMHYGGQLADMAALTELAREHDLALIEDAAHAHGASLDGRRAGAWGDFGTFSFHSLKNMTTLGEGGMLTVRDARRAESVPALRSMGLVPYSDQEDYWLPYHYDVQAPGGHLPWNARLGEPAAAVGRVQLRRLPDFNARRRAIASQWDAALRDVPELLTPELAPGCEHVYHLYTLLLADGGERERDTLVRRLYREHGVQPILHYLPSQRFTLYRERGATGDCPVADDAFSRLFNLPIHPGLTDAQVTHVIEAVRASIEAESRAGA